MMNTVTIVPRSTNSAPGWQWGVGEGVGAVEGALSQGCRVLSVTPPDSSPPSRVSTAEWTPQPSA